MNIDVKWLDIDSDPLFNEILIDSLNNVKKNEYIDSISATISKRPNSRHIIDLKIKTKNPDEYLYVSGNSFNLDYSLSDLNTNLKKMMKNYNPKTFVKQKQLEEEYERQREINRKRKEERINKELLSKEEFKKRKIKEQEAARLKKLEEKNKEIMKKLEQKRKREEEQEKLLLKELEDKMKQIEKEKQLEQERLAKVFEEISNVNQEIEKDLLEDEKVKTEIQESKDKLRDLWAEENECLVIIDQIKQWTKKEFSSRYYKTNQPFELVPGRVLYHDGQENFFICNENNEWEPFYDIDQEFEQMRAVKLQDLEQKLIIARAKRKHHMKDLVDEGEIIAKLKESKNVLKQKQVEQKKELQELKKDQKLISELSKNEMKIQASDIIDSIDVAEIHEANVPFEVKEGIFAYHDGEGNYYLQNVTTQEWMPVEKSYIYGDNAILNLNLVEDHTPNEPFENEKGIYFYHDGLGHYFKSVENNWVQSTYEECYPKKAKLIKKRRKEKMNDKSDVSYVDIVTNANRDIENKKANVFSQNGVNQDIGAFVGQATDQSTNTWQDQTTGIWWCIDNEGNYFYADENGNWLPYNQ